MARKASQDADADEPVEKVPQPPLTEPASESQDSTDATSEETLPLTELLTLNVESATNEQIQQIVCRHVSWKLAATRLMDTYNVLLLHDTGSMARSDANRIYRAISGADQKRPILLIINSRGGDIAAAYFIAKLCREHTEAFFEVAVPRQAKSAATLICCGADSIHMGSLSELGPIDPQFGAVPALALKHSVEHLAQLANQYPAASSMFSDYLAKSLRVEALGYYERVAESATQYAVRLLNARRLQPNSPEVNAEIARRLVYTYKDHSFAIDAREAIDIFGNIVVCNTGQYAAANDLYSDLDFVEFIVSWLCTKSPVREMTRWSMRPRRSVFKPFLRSNRSH